MVGNAAESWILLLNARVPYSYLRGINATANRFRTILAYHRHEGQAIGISRKLKPRVARPLGNLAPRQYTTGRSGILPQHVPAILRSADTSVGLA